jgi:RimJ/RimL family protein N-acetyltransferase
MDIPTLTTPRLVLRAFRAADWDAFSTLNADPTVRDPLGGVLLSREQTWTQIETFLGQWALRGYGMFAVESAGRFIGRVGLLHFIDWPEPELAWTLAASVWGQGLATEAAAEVKRWAFTTLRRDRLVSYIRSGNTRSQRVAAKLGAAQDGKIELRGVLSEIWVHPAPGHGIVT